MFRDLSTILPVYSLVLGINKFMRMKFMYESLKGIYLDYVSFEVINNDIDSKISSNAFFTIAKFTCELNQV